MIPSLVDRHDRQSMASPLVARMGKHIASAKVADGPPEVTTPATGGHELTTGGASPPWAWGGSSAGSCLSLSLTDLVVGVDLGCRAREQKKRGDRPVANSQLSLRVPLTPN